MAAVRAVGVAAVAAVELVASVRLVQVMQSPAIVRLATMRRAAITRQARPRSSTATTSMRKPRRKQAPKPRLGLGLKAHAARRLLAKARNVAAVADAGVDAVAAAGTAMMQHAKQQAEKPAT